MSTLTVPVHTGSLNRKPLRFFKAPLAGPHLVWHAFDDLLACLKLPQSLQRDFRQKLRRDWSGDVRTVATSDGVVTIAPHWMAQGLIGSMIEVRQVRASLEMDYAKQAVEAWNALCGDLPPMAGVELMLAAFRNTHGIDGAAP